MSGENVPSSTENAEPQAVIDATQTQEGQKAVTDEALESLREMQENAGQMSEITKEEETLVADFFNFLMTVLKPFTKTLEITVSALPKKYSERASKAYLYLTGQLILVYQNGEAEILNLTEPDNYEILIEITGEIMQKLKAIINSHKSKAEKRVNFLMTITKELQKVANIFAEK